MKAEPLEIIDGLKMAFDNEHENGYVGGWNEALAAVKSKLNEMPEEVAFDEELPYARPEPIARYKATLKIEGCSVCGAKYGEQHCAVAHACHDNPGETIAINCSCPKCSPR